MYCRRPVFRSTPVVVSDGVEGLCRENLAGHPVEDVDVAVALRPDEHLPGLPLPGHVEQDLLVDPVPIIEIVRAPLVEPARLTRFRLARKDAGRPLVVAGPLVGVPGTGIARAVIEEIEIGVVGEPPPDRAAALLPGLGRPRRHPEILALVHVVKWLERRPDQHVLVRPRIEGLPGDLATLLVERLDPAAHTEFAARITDEDFAPGDERRHRHGLADVDVADLRFPRLTPGLGIDRDDVAVEGVEEDMAIRESRPAIDHITACDALGRSLGLRIVLPFQGRARLRQVQRVKDVGVGREDVHRPADHER